MYEIVVAHDNRTCPSNGNVNGEFGNRRLDFADIYIYIFIYLYLFIFIYIYTHFLDFKPIQNI
jgi:hypothetical protein